MQALAIAGASLIASVVGAFISSDAATSAADTQAAAGKAASQAQLAMFNSIKNSLAPYMLTGYGALPSLATLTGTNSGGDPMTAPLTGQINPSQAELENLPGYKWARDQGILATQNAQSSMGRGGWSGPVLKGVTEYATGLASQNWDKLFNQKLANRSQTFNMLTGLAGIGQNAAAMTGQAGTQAQNAASQYLTSAAAAQAAGTVGSANAWTQALGGIVPNYMQAYMLSNIYPQMANSYGGGTSGAGASGGGGVG